MPDEEALTRLRAAFAAKRTPSVRDLEQALRELGMPAKTAKRVMAIGARALGERTESEMLTELAEHIADVARDLRP